MGNNVVAVLYTDMMEEMGRPNAGDRLTKGVRSFLNGREELKGYMGFGQCISWDHSSAYQVCAVGKNTGYRLGLGRDVPHEVLAAVARALEFHGYKVTAPKKVRVSPEAADAPQS